MSLFKFIYIGSNHEQGKVFQHLDDEDYDILTSATLLDTEFKLSDHYCLAIRAAVTGPLVTALVDKLTLARFRGLLVVLYETSSRRLGNLISEFGERAGLRVVQLRPEEIDKGWLQDLSARYLPRFRALSSKEWPVSEQAVCGALDINACQPVFQPIFNVPERELIGYELLLRLQVDGHNISPEYVFDVASKHHKLEQLTQQILAKGLQAFAPLVHQQPQLTLSVNLLTRELVYVDESDLLTRLCHQYAIPTNNIIVELTEQEDLGHEADVLAALLNMHQSGFKLSADDYGTGYSTVERLLLIPFQQVKLDKSYVDKLIQDEAAQVFIRGVIRLANALNMQVIAEGVEDEATLAMLHQYECKGAQGYLLGKPLPNFAASGYDIDG